MAKQFFGIRDPKGELMTAKRIGSRTQYFAKKETAKKYRNALNEGNNISEENALAGNGYTITLGPDHWKYIDPTLEMEMELADES